MALKRFLDEPQTLTGPTPFEKVLLGVAESGIRDLDKNHPFYLTEKLKRTS